MKKFRSSTFRRASDAQARRVMLGLAVMIYASMYACSGPDRANRFTEEDIPLSAYGLFDLGVVDADGDGRLDLFTSNHSGVQSLLLNRGARGFEEVFSEWHLDQDPAFPGLGVVRQPVSPDQDGVYVGWRAPAVSVQSRGVAVSGHIDLLTDVELQASQGFKVDVSSVRDATPGAATTRIAFSSTGDGYFEFVPIHHALPIAFHLDQPTDPAHVFVGPGKVAPGSDDFTMDMLDRHGMAWADYNGDSLMDVFITRGGLSGTVGESPQRLWNQLYVQGPAGHMTDIARSVGLDLGTCPGRQVAWTDFDGDGRLDLYVICGRDASGPTTAFRNRLFRQKPDGTFEDVAAAVGLDLDSEGKAAWVDVDQDHDQDMVWADRTGLSWFENEGNRFHRHAIESRAGVHFDALRVIDIDQDGDPDLLAVSGEENVLLINEGGSFRAVNPSDLGLPAESLTAVWADVDDDGVEELFAVPGGLYKRRQDGHYARTGLLDFKTSRLSPFGLADAHSAWVDLDNDGTRDLVVALNLVTKKRKWAELAAWLLGQSNSGEGALRGHWITEVYRNGSTSNHWLEVALKGPSGNREAIGAMVRVKASGLDRVHRVGDAESSRYSQGHYRTYFGLGQVGSIEKLSVEWPDGHVEQIRDPGIDRVITLSEEAPHGD